MTRDSRMRTLGELASELPGAVLDAGARSVAIRSITTDSRAVEPGALFVALSGTRTDGHEFLREVVNRGAAAIVVEREPDAELAVPVIRVENSRAALARLAAAWYGKPADRLRLFGVTGTFGKTSVVKMLEAILSASGIEVGTIGTLGVSGPEGEQQTGYTSPDPLLLHEALDRMAESGCRLVGMEVTSHALDQERVHGLTYAIGVFTNLVPLEHSDYHPTFRSYVAVKRRFLDHLEPGAPLVHSADDAMVRRLARRGGIEPIACGQSPDAAVGIEELRTGLEGSSLRMRVRRPLPLVGGGTLAPLDIPLELTLLGRPSVINAVFAATAGLCLGADPSTIGEALRAFDPLPRRMNLSRYDDFLVLDDAANHPDAISALFEVVERLPVQRAHAIFAIRGNRGPQINRRTAEALAIWARRRPLDTLMLTRSEDVVGEWERVQQEERSAFREALRRAGIAFEEVGTLEAAVNAVLERVQRGDLVLTLGTQGMDGSPEQIRTWLARRSGTEPGLPTPGGG